MEIFNRYPALNTSPTSDIVAFFSALTGQNQLIKVPFGTEGGLFHEKCDIPTIIMGPGSMQQGHQADEYVTHEQLAQCQHILNKLLQKMV